MVNGLSKMPNKVRVIVPNMQYYEMKISTLKKENSKLKKMIYTLANMKKEPEDDTYPTFQQPICFYPKPPY